MRKTVQTMSGEVLVAGKSKECQNIACTHFTQHYYASGLLQYIFLQKGSTIRSQEIAKKLIGESFIRIWEAVMVVATLL
jgi:hypothetical protein